MRIVRNAHIMEYDGYLYVIYSRNKEDIQLTKVSIDLLP